MGFISWIVWLVDCTKCILPISWQNFFFLLNPLNMRGIERLLQYDVTVQHVISLISLSIACPILRIRNNSLLSFLSILFLFQWILSKHKHPLSVCLDSLFFASLFYYLTYICYYLWAPLHFLVLFINLTILFQLTFTFIYYTFSKKNSVLAK